MIAEAGVRGLGVQARKERAGLAPRHHRTNSATRMRHSHGRGVSRRSRENAKARWCATRGREILATARALRVGAMNCAEACLRLRKSNAIDMKKYQRGWQVLGLSENF
eukprot:4841342-Pyramimonas_sp.AAC.1